MSEAITVATPKKIDVAHAPVLKDTLDKILDEGADFLIIDMKDTIYVSSVGLRVFLAIQKRINAAGRNMVVKNVKPQVMDVFDITGFSGLLTFE